MSNQKRNTKPMIPTIFHVNREGKKRYVSDKEALEAILEAVYRGEEIVNIDGHIFQIKEQIRNDDVWTVEVVV